MNHPRLLPAALLALGFTGASHAQVVLFSNLEKFDSGTMRFENNDSRFASDFRTDSVPRTLIEITAQMHDTGVIEYRISFSIYTDNGAGKPDALVGTFDRGGSLLPGPTQLVTATTDGINLLPNTTYWVVGRVLPDTDIGNVFWGYTLAQSTDDSPFTALSGTEILKSTDAGGRWTAYSTGNLKYSLEGFSTVPEPETWVALAVTVGSFLALRGRGLNRRPPS